MRVDQLVALALLAAIELQVWLSGGIPDRLAATVAGAAIGLSVAFRRRWPLRGMLVLIAVLAVRTVLGGGGGSHQPVGVMAALLLMVYGMGAFAPPRRSQWALALLVVVSGANNLSKPGNGLTEAVVSAIIVVLVPYALGRWMRARAARAQIDREHAERLDATRELTAQAAALEERARIARELHDVIAHSVSVMVIQAGGARLVIDADVDRAEASLRAVEQAGNEALAEMRRLLGLLGDGEPRALAPQPGLRRSPGADRGRPHGRSRHRLCGSTANALTVSPALDLCAYRVVQEALTNAIKHAAPARADVQGPLAGGRARVGDLRRRPRVGRGHRCRRRARDRRHARKGGLARWQRRRRAARGRRLCGSCWLPLAGELSRTMTALRARAAAFDPIRLDVILAIAVIIELELQCSLGRGISDVHRLLTAVACVLFAGPIAVRRRAPGLSLVFCATVAAIQTPLGGQVPSGSFSGTAADVMPAIVLLVLGYAAGAWLDARRGAAAMLTSTVLVFICSYLPDGGGAPAGVGATAQTLFYAAVMVVPGWLAGRLSRAQGRRSAGFKELAAVAAAEHAARRSAAIASERERIGGELLQDIIAHSVSVMVVQAGSARLLLRSDPDHARESILNVEHTGREALADLRRLLGMLRKDDDPRALSPQPGLKQLPALIDFCRESGFACELRTQGDPINLTPGVDLVAYRVIEAALRAAADQRLSHGVLTVRYTTAALELDITGDGQIPGFAERLRAIADRVALYDGTLRTASARSRGFELQARLPTRTAVAA